MSWIFDLLGGKSSKPEAESAQPAKKSDWFDGIMKDEAITKEASIQDDRIHCIKNLSTDALAHIYTELVLKKENKKIPENYVEEYLKQKEAVMKDREKVEKSVLELIPVHSQDLKFKKSASKSSVLDVDSIWIVKDVDGEEVIVRATPTTVDMKKESIKEVKANDTLFSPKDVVKNKSFEMAAADEVGIIEEFDNLFLDASFICCNFEKSGRAWVKANQVSKLTTEELSLRKSALEQTSFYGPLSEYMLQHYKINMKEAGLKQMAVEIKSALGKTIASFEEVPSDVLEKVANAFIQDPDYTALYDRPLGGHDQKTDNMNQQVPVVYRNTDEDAHNPNTKDFGEVYHQDKLSPEKQSSLDVKATSNEAKEFMQKHIKKHIEEDGMDQAQAVRVAFEEARAKGYEVPAAPEHTYSSDDKCDQCGKPAESGSVKQIADGVVCPSCQKEYHKEMGVPYDTTGPLVKKMKLSKLDTIAKEDSSHGASSMVGDGKLPNKYWVTIGGSYVMYDESGDPQDLGNDEHETFGPFDTFKEAQSKYNELKESDLVSPETSEEKGYHSIMIEDRLAGTIYEGMYEGHSNINFEFEERDDTKYTKEKLGDKFAFRVRDLRKKATVQYVDETGQVKRPDEIGVADIDTAPEEVATADGKKYKKQKLA